MFYGQCTPLKWDIDQGWFTLKCGKHIITIRANQTANILCDPYYDTAHNPAYIRNFTFNEIIENTDLDELEFVDDLMYICGIGIE